MHGNNQDVEIYMNKHTCSTSIHLENWLHIALCDSGDEPMAVGD